jgi:hypothetical protein
MHLLTSRSRAPPNRVTRRFANRVQASSHPTVRLRHLASPVSKTRILSRKILPKALLIHARGTTKNPPSIVATGSLGSWSGLVVRRRRRVMHFQPTTCFLKCPSRGTYSHTHIQREPVGLPHICPSARYDGQQAGLLTGTRRIRLGRMLPRNSKG